MSGKNVTEVRLADAAGIAEAARILESGGLVAVPTETVYGLAARADSAEAVAKIYAAKGRPDFNPLIVHVRNRDHALDFAQWSEAADWAACTYWPGPLTLVVPRKPGAKLASAVTAGLETVAVRSPSHPVMRALLAQVDFALAAPSANRSGFISPTSAEHVLASLDGRIDLVLDGATCRHGVESSIYAVRADGTYEELRPGLIDLRDDEPRDIASDTPRGIEAPGQLASHYAPGKPVRLNAERAESDEFLIGFGAVKGDVTLSASGNLKEAATRLYAALHESARAPQPRIAVAPVPEEGVGRAINDRLRRAAA
jgi:L-threonylcarbamoyladenylate synthase